MAKRFALVSFGLLCLSLAALVGLHLGSKSAHAVEPEAISGWRVTQVDETQALYHVLLSNGDVFVRSLSLPNGRLDDPPATYTGNYWDGPAD